MQNVKMMDMQVVPHTKGFIAKAQYTLAGSLETKVRSIKEAHT